MYSQFLSLWEKRGRPRSPTKNFANEAVNNALQLEKRKNPEAYVKYLHLPPPKRWHRSLTLIQASVIPPNQEQLLSFVPDPTDTVPISSKATAPPGPRN